MVHVFKKTEKVVPGSNNCTKYEEKQKPDTHYSYFYVKQHEDKISFNAIPQQNNAQPTPKPKSQPQTPTGTAGSKHSVATTTASLPSYPNRLLQPTNRQTVDELEEMKPENIKKVLIPEPVENVFDDLYRYPSQTI